MLIQPESKKRVSLPFIFNSTSSNSFIVVRLSNITQKSREHRVIKLSDISTPNMINNLLNSLTIKANAGDRIEYELYARFFQDNDTVVSRSLIFPHAIASTGEDSVVQSKVFFNFKDIKNVYLFAICLAKNNRLFSSPPFTWGRSNIIFWACIEVGTVSQTNIY